MRNQRQRSHSPWFTEQERDRTEICSVCKFPWCKYSRHFNPLACTWNRGEFPAAGLASEDRLAGHTVSGQREHSQGHESQLKFSLRPPTSIGWARAPTRFSGLAARSLSPSPLRPKQRELAGSTGHYCMHLASPPGATLTQWASAPKALGTHKSPTSLPKPSSTHSLQGLLIHKTIFIRLEEKATLSNSYKQTQKGKQNDMTEEYLSKKQEKFPDKKRNLRKWKK